MPRMSMRARGIVLASFTMMLIAACTPPMPPDVLAARAESQITCDPGTVDVAVAETFTGSISAVGAALTSVCPDENVTEVAGDAPAPLAVVDRTPSEADIAAFDTASCPAGDAVVVPAFAYPVTMAYNVLGLDGLVMTPEIVAGILQGTIVSWDDPTLAASNTDFDLSGLPPITLVSVDSPQGSVEAMTTWTSQYAPDAWTSGPSGVIAAGKKVPSVADLLAELTATEGAIAVLPIFQALNNSLPVANLPVTLTGADGAESELVITSSDVQMFKVGASATTVTTDDRGNILVSPSVGCVPTEGVFDLASSKIILSEGQPLVGWPVVGYAHLLVCDDPANTLALSLAQYVVRLAGQGSLESFGVTPMPEPIRVKTFTPLKVTVSTGDSSATPSS